MRRVRTVIGIVAGENDQRSGSGTLSMGRAAIARSLGT